MDGRLTRDLYNVELRQQSPSSNLNNRATACWQRSVKRKYDDVSLAMPRNVVLGNADVWKDSCPSEAPQHTFPRKDYFQRASCCSRESQVLIRISDLEEDEGYSQQLVPVPHLCAPFSLLEEERSKLSSATLEAEDVEFVVESSRGNEGGGRTLFPKKNRALGMTTSQRSPGVGFVQKGASEREIIQLRQALKSEKRALQRLYVELEEERCASATAANEAMAMISRLQEEKAAIQMEAQQYRRVAEEREVHHREAIAFLKEFVMNKEDDILALQDQIEAYRMMFLRIESEGLGRGRARTNLLEGSDKEGALFLEGQGQGSTSSQSCMGSNHGKCHLDNDCACISNGAEGDLHSRNRELPDPKTSNRSKPSVSTGVRPAGFSDDVSCDYDERQVENASVRNLDMGDWIFEKSVNRKDSLDENMTWESQRFEDTEMVELTSGRVQGTFETYKSDTVSVILSQEHSLEDSSASILARVKRLEERFQDLGKTQAYEGQAIDRNVEALQNDATVFDDVVLQKTGITGLEAVHGKSKRFSEEVKEYAKCSSFDRRESDLENGFHDANVREANGERGAPADISVLRTDRLDVWRAAPTMDDLCNENEVDPGEGVHDVYEVHHDIKETSVHHSECVIRDDFEISDVMSVNNLQESVNTSQAAGPKYMEFVPAMASKHHGALFGEREGCEPEIDKLSFDRSSPVVKDAPLNTAEEGVYQLQIRLQALETERVFMKQAIDSLRKENMELKLLQEIAQQLRELKGDVKTRGQLKERLHEDQPSICSFFKGVLSFTGLQNTADAEANRFMWPFQKNLDSKVNKEHHDGLFYLLEKPESRTSACVTRGLKVRLPGSARYFKEHASPLLTTLCEKNNLSVLAVMIA